jgi:GGDEF domain-containing protein
VSPSTDNQGAKAIIKRIEKDLGDIVLDKQIIISVSIGVAIFPSEPRNLDGLIEVATKRCI